MNHFAKEMWLNNSSLREDINQIIDLLVETNEKIEKLEEENPPQNVVRDILMVASFIGLVVFY